MSFAFLSCMYTADSTRTWSPERCKFAFSCSCQTLSFSSIALYAQLFSTEYKDLYKFLCQGHYKVTPGTSRSWPKFCFPSMWMTNSTQNSSICFVLWDQTMPKTRWFHVQSRVQEGDTILKKIYASSLPCPFRSLLVYNVYTPKNKKIWHKCEPFSLMI